MIETGLTFMFVVGELPVGHSEPSLLEVSLAQAFSSLSTFLYLPMNGHTHTGLRLKWKKNQPLLIILSIIFFFLKLQGSDWR